MDYRTGILILKEGVMIFVDEISWIYKKKLIKYKNDMVYLRVEKCLNKYVNKDYESNLVNMIAEYAIEEIEEYNDTKVYYHGHRYCYYGMKDYYKIIDLVMKHNNWYDL